MIEILRRRLDSAKLEQYDFSADPFYGRTRQETDGTRTVCVHENSERTKFGEGWFTDADELIVRGSTVYFFYNGPGASRGDTVLFDDNGVVSMWRYGGAYRITSMQHGDLYA